jgi:hypothetical protein
MKYDFSVPLIDFNGQPVKTNEGNLLTYGDSVMQLVLAGAEQDSPEEKYMAYSLCNRIAYESAQVELSVKEAAFVLSKAEKYGHPLSYGRIKDLLEPQ